MLATVELKCTDVRRLLPDYLNGTMDVADAQRMRWHFGQCKDCRMIVRSAVETFRANFRDDRSRISSARRAA